MQVLTISDQYGVANPISEYFLLKKLFPACAMRSEGALVLLIPGFQSQTGGQKFQRIQLV